MAINIEWQVKPPSKVRRTSERTQYETVPKNAGTCIGLRRYLHRPAQIPASACAGICMRQRRYLR